MRYFFVVSSTFFNSHFITYLSFFLLSAVSVLEAGFNAPGVTPVPITEGGLDKDALNIFDRNLASWNLLPAQVQANTPRPTYPPFEDVPAAKVATLSQFPPFQGKTNAQIVTKVQQMRRAVICAIDLVAQENRDKAVALQRLLRLQKLCFGLRRTQGNVGAAIFPDGRPDFGVEPINLFLPICTEPTLTSTDMFDLYKALSHEGLHGMQTVLQPTGRTNLAGAVDLQCREIEAHTGDLQRVCDMLDVVNSIRNNNKLPDNLTFGNGSTFTFGASILASPNKAALLAQWIRYLEAKKPQERMFLEFRQAYKTAGQASLNGTTDAAALRKIYRFRQWTQIFGTNRDFGPITGAVPEIGTIYRGGRPTITGEEGSRSVSGGGMKMFLIPELIDQDVVVPGIDNVTDAHIDFTNHLLFVGGFTNGEVNLGRLGTFDIDPVNGRIIEDSFHLLLETPMLGTGFDIVPNNFETGNNLYGVKMETGGICRFMDGTGDGILDMAMHVGDFVPDGVTPIVDCQFINQDTIVGYNNPIGTVFDRDTMLSCARRSEPGGMFDDSMLKRAGNFFSQPPSIGGLPFVGRTDLPLVGTPGRGFEVFFVPLEGGGDPHLAGTGVFGHSGFACPPLNHPITAEYLLEIADSENDRSPLILCAPTPGFFPVLQDRNIGGPNDTWSGRASSWPGQPFLSQNSWDMNTWDQLESGTGGPFGDKVFFFNPSITMEKPAEFWRIFNDNSATPPGGDNEDFSITPGLETNLYIKDSLGAYFGYELLEAPDLPESRFQWNKDGSYTVSLTTFGSPITFTYRRFSSNPLIPFGPPTTVVIAGDNSAFTDPEPYPAGSDPEDQFVDAYVLEYGGFSYPAYQFFLAHSEFDVCKEPHWHSSVDVFLWKLLRVASRIRILPNVDSVFSRSCHPKRLRFP